MRKRFLESDLLTVCTNMKPFASKMLLWGFTVSALRLKGVDTDIFLITYVFVGVSLSEHTIL